MKIDIASIQNPQVRVFYSLWNFIGVKMNRIFFTGLFVLLLVLAACSSAVDPQDQLAIPSVTAQPVAQQAEGQEAALSPTETAPPTTEQGGAKDAAPIPSVTAQPIGEQAGVSEATPACSGVLTSANQEGPYYTPGSPERTSLIEPGMPGVPILIQGYVFNQDCSPLAGAKVDFWQANAEGVYDNAGYTLRGHVLTDENGFYSIETIAPGIYTGRPPHIHVKVFAVDGSELLTTQMYFPGSEDSADVQAAPDLLVTLQEADEQGRQQVFFSFTVQE